MTKFGTLPRSTFTPPPPTRGGNTGFFVKEEEEPLRGEVRGLKAAAGEERLVRSTQKGIGKGRVRDFYFRYSPGVPKGVPGWKELDLLAIGYGRNVAVSVKDLSFVHLTASAEAEDKLTELILLTRLRQVGLPVDKIHTVDASKLATQAGADKVAKDLGIL